MRNFGPDMDCRWPTFMKQRCSRAVTAQPISAKLTTTLKDWRRQKAKRTCARIARASPSSGLTMWWRNSTATCMQWTACTRRTPSICGRNGLYETYRDQIKSIWRLTERHWDGVTSPLTKEQDLTSFLTREAQSWLARQIGGPAFLPATLIRAAACAFNGLTRIGPATTASWKFLGVP